MSTKSIGQTITESERSISAVRWVLALVGAALALGSRSGDVEGEGWIRACAVAATIVCVAAALSRGPHLLERIGVERVLGSILLQVLDTAAALGFAWVVSDVLEDAAWALLTIPIVIASLRLNVAGVLGVWLVTSLGYAAMLSEDLISPGRSALQTSIVLERPGALLAIAAGVALMTRWLQAGWADQSRLTSEAVTRFGHVRTIEHAGREMRSKTPEQVLSVCLHHVVELGFDAATATGPSSLVAAGEGSIVPADQVFDPPPTGGVELTEWQGPDSVVYSAAMLEPRSGVVITGWSAQPPGTLEADALADLVAQTTSSVELAELLTRARFDADHDALTGLANRSKFERQLRASAAQPAPVAMLFMDLDHFKEINDTHGHDAGDWALRAVAHALRSTLGRDCLAARHGGDEFVALLPGVDDHAADEVAQRLLAAVAGITSDASVAGAPIVLRISIGIAWAVGPIDPDELRRTADDALLDAKRRGRGRTSMRRLPTKAERAAPVLGSPTVGMHAGFPVPSMPSSPAGVTTFNATDMASIAAFASALVPLVPPSQGQSTLAADSPSAPPSAPHPHHESADSQAFAPPSPDSRVASPEVNGVLTGQPR